MVSGLNERRAMILPHTIAKLFAQMNKDEDDERKPYRFLHLPERIINVVEWSSVIFTAS